MAPVGIARRHRLSILKTDIIYSLPLRIALVNFTELTQFRSSSKSSKKSGARGDFLLNSLDIIISL